jgi:hypothetical protein
MNQPRDHRRMIEIADVEVGRVVPVIGFLGVKVGPRKKCNPKQEQRGSEKERAALQATCFTIVGRWRSS